MKKGSMKYDKMADGTKAGAKTHKNKPIGSRPKHAKRFGKKPSKSKMC